RPTWGQMSSPRPTWGRPPSAVRPSAARLVSFVQEEKSSRLSGFVSQENQPYHRPRGDRCPHHGPRGDGRPSAVRPSAARPVSFVQDEKTSRLSVFVSQENQPYHCPRGGRCPHHRPRGDGRPRPSGRAQLG